MNQSWNNNNIKYDNNNIEYSNNTKQINFENQKIGKKDFRRIINKKIILKIKNKDIEWM